MCLDCIERSAANDSGNIDAARIVEVSDAGHGTWTSYRMAPGDTFQGNLSSSGDRDWVAITLTEGQTYTIDLSGSGSGIGTLSDPYLRLHSASGSQVAYNDDSGPGLDSSLTYTAPSSGTFYISAGAYIDRSTGSYTISVSEPAAPGTLDELADYLTHGYWQDSGRSARRFDVSSDNIITVNLSDLTEDGARLARWALEAWELVAGIEFSETSSSADITFDDDRSGAYASSSVSGGRILSSEINISTSWLSTYGTSIDSYSFQTYIHEIGHALGLGHQGNYNGTATYGRSETFANDSWQMSIMSYFDQQDNTSVDASRAYLLTPMMADVLAIQNLYGGPGANSATAGDTTWGGGSNLPGVLGDNSRTARHFEGRSVALTVADQGGTDTLNFARYSANSRIDLREGRLSDVGGLTGNVGIARGTVVENLISGSGKDQVMGNAAGNYIRTQGGNDRISGRAGKDTIRSGSGDDRVDGNTGNDHLSGQDGNDSVTGGDGNDKIFGGQGFDLLSGNLGNDTLQGGSGSDTLTGHRGNDHLSGQGGYDTLVGGKGHDTIYGGKGNDEVTGGDGKDKLYGAYGADTLDGGDSADTLDGGEGDDALDGGNGEDHLFGGAHMDTLYGHRGNDHLSGQDDGDILFGGRGRDTVYGGQGNDELKGGSGSDKLYGGDQSDSLDGGTGNDVLGGGAGADLFIFKKGFASDQIVDFGNGSDTLALGGFGFSSAKVAIESHAQEVGENVVFDFGGGDVLTLLDLQLSDLTGNISVI